jgi:hypothetical protein
MGNVAASIFFQMGFHRVKYLVKRDSLLSKGGEEPRNLLTVSSKNGRE